MLSEHTHNPLLHIRKQSSELLLVHSVPRITLALSGGAAKQAARLKGQVIRRLLHGHWCQRVYLSVLRCRLNVSSAERFPYIIQLVRIFQGKVRRPFIVGL